MHDSLTIRVTFTPVKDKDARSDTEMIASIIANWSGVQKVRVVRNSVPASDRDGVSIAVHHGGSDRTVTRDGTR